MSLNFNDVANKQMAEIERPPLPPVGTYRWRVSKIPEQTESQSGEWDIVTFQVQAIEALDDVDVDEYKGEIANIRQRVVFMFNKADEAEFEKSLFRLRTFLEKHLGLTEPTVSENLNASVGAEFLGTIKWRQDKNDEDMFYADIGRTAPVE